MFGDTPMIFAPGGVDDGSATPSDHGLISWAFDPSGVTGATQHNNGTILLVKVGIARAATANALCFHVAGGAVLPIAGQNEVGLYDSTGSLLAVANVDAVIVSTGGKIVAIPGTVLAAGRYWVAMVFNCTSATPFVGNGAHITAAQSLINMGLVAAECRYALHGTGTTLPASIDPELNTPHDAAVWAAIGS